VLRFAQVVSTLIRRVGVSNVLAIASSAQMLPTVAVASPDIRIPQLESAVTQAPLAIPTASAAVEATVRPVAAPTYYTQTI